jgi:hypothetical protein
MTELSPEARALFEAARNGHEPTAHEREQMNARILKVAALAAVSGVSKTGATAGLSGLASGKVAGAMKVTFALAVAGVLGVGAARLVVEKPRPSAVASPRTRPVAPPRSPPSPTRVMEPVGAVAASPQSASASAVAPSHAPESFASARAGTRPMPRDPAAAPGGRPASPSLPASSPAEPAVAAFPESADAAIADLGARAGEPLKAGHAALGDASLGEEARGLAAVQRALDQGRPSEALALLDEQERRFRRGELAPERRAARVLAHCAGATAEQARTLAQRFVEQEPNSPLAVRVRRACGVR